MFTLYVPKMFYSTFGDGGGGWGDGRVYAGNSFDLEFDYFCLRYSEKYAK